MEYAKLQLVDTRGHAWRTASMHARGAAVTILAYCADQENGGRIEACQTWTQAQWQAIVDVRPIDVARAVEAGLCRWDGTALVCLLYDVIGHRRLTVQREQGPHGAKGGRPKRTLADNPSGNPKGFGRETPSPDQTTPDHTTPPMDPRLAAVAAAGGYLHLDRDNVDLTPRWLEALHDLPLERVVAVMDYGRARRGEPVRVPFGAESFHTFSVELQAADQRQATQQRQQDDTTTRAAQVSEENERAAAGSQRILAHVSALDPDAVDQLASECARRGAAATSALRRALDGKPLTALLVGLLRRASPTLAAIADGRDPEAA